MISKEFYSSVYFFDRSTDSSKQQHKHDSNNKFTAITSCKYLQNKAGDSRKSPANVHVLLFYKFAFTLLCLHFPLCYPNALDIRSSRIRYCKLCFVALSSRSIE